MEIGRNTTLVILVVALLAIGAYLVVNLDTTDKTISVNGVSEVTAKPDLTVIYFSVETLDKSASESQTENTKASSEVIDALKVFIDSEKIETLSLNVYEDYDYTSGGRIFKGYKTTHYMKVSLDNNFLAGRVIDAVVEKGALINQVSFELNKDNENKLKAEALERATQDARNKAEAIAKGSGGKLGKLVSVNTNDYGYYPYVAYARAEGGSADGIMAKESATQINTRTLTINANVQAVYKIN